MFTPRRATFAASFLFALTASVSLAETPNLGKPIDEAAIAAWDISIQPDGAGLPKGSGTPAQGAPIYAEKCSACHGDNGKGALAAALVDSRPNIEIAGISASLILAVAIGRYLAAETQAAWPHLDASTMVLSLFATWLTARGKLENWLYWIVVDAIQAWLYAAQGLVFTAFLFLVYLVIAFVGLIEWSKTYRRQTVG